MAKSKKNASRAAARNKAALQEKMLVGALNADRARVFRQGENIGYTEATVIMLWLLRTEYGFGKKRLAGFLHRIEDFCKSFLVPEGGDGTFAGITVEDMCQALKDECDITIDLKSGLINIDGIKILEDNEVTADERVDKATSATV